MSKIESLTAEQWRHVYAERERWRAIGTCTEPADRQTAERVISGFYRRMGKKPPRFVWLDGPLSCGVAVALLRNRNQVGNPLVDQLGNQLGDPLRGHVWSHLADRLDTQLSQLVAQLRSQLHDQLRNELEGHLGEQLGDQLGGQLWGSLWHHPYFRDQDDIGAQLEGEMRAQLRAHLWGQECAHWIAFMSVPRDLGVVYSEEQSQLLDEWAQLAASTGWWWPYEKVCLCAERPRHVSFDERYLLHSETGPAIECRDGYRVYAWHGTRIPSEWIESPKTLTPEVVFGVEDMEQRRAAAEILGWDAILQALEATVVDQHPDPAIGTLYRVDLPGASNARILRMRCGTGRMFAQPVPETIETAMEAQEWIWRKPPGGYRPEVRT